MFNTAEAEAEAAEAAKEAAVRENLRLADEAEDAVCEKLVLAAEAKAMKEEAVLEELHPIVVAKAAREAAVYEELCIAAEAEAAKGAVEGEPRIDYLLRRCQVWRSRYG